MNFHSKGQLAYLENFDDYVDSCSEVTGFNPLMKTFFFSFLFMTKTCALFEQLLQLSCRILSCYYFQHENKATNTGCLLKIPISDFFFFYGVPHFVKTCHVLSSNIMHVLKDWKAQKAIFIRALAFGNECHLEM